MHFEGCRIRWTSSAQSAPFLRAISLLCLLLLVGSAAFAETPVSEATRQCLDCHESVHPGIVADWRQSRHAVMTPKQALLVKDRNQKILTQIVSDALMETTVGCAECHTLNAAEHPDTVSHNGFDVHPVVTPRDCAACHATERDQYADNIMSHAHRNLTDNVIYQDLQRSILSPVSWKQIETATSSLHAEAVTCYYCHGTKMAVTGVVNRSTDMGDMVFPVLSGWPNNGVGRINPDGTMGACTACHPRHAFSQAVARKPATCKECHNGPDVPAYKVYDASKHGNIAAAQQGKWNFTTTPWVIGKDFTAPTCAACHISLLVSEDGNVVADRTHRMNNRLAWRIFGLPYPHPQPILPDVTVIRNADGQPLPTDFGGGTAKPYLIDEKEQRKRTETMQAVCRACHGTSWVAGHWQRFESTIQRTHSLTKAATDMIVDVWKQKLAKGYPESLFDEPIEKLWSGLWLYDANNIRFTAAMAGGGDYAVFAEGYAPLSKRLAEMVEWIARQRKLPK